MEFSKSTPKKEITIAKQVLTVIAPYAEGHTLTAEEANALNQTLAENLRNNFAPHVKAVVEAAGEGEVDLAGLQAELDTYMGEYSFGFRKSGTSIAANPVERIAVSLARDAVKKALVAKGKSVKDFTAEQINELAVAAVGRNPAFTAQAEAIHAAKKAAAAEVLGDLAA